MDACALHRLSVIRLVLMRIANTTTLPHRANVRSVYGTDPHVRSVYGTELPVPAFAFASLYRSVTCRIIHVVPYT